MTVVFASGLIALDCLHAAASSSTPRDLTSRGAINIHTYSDQLGLAGYAVTLAVLPRSGLVEIDYS
ncbi:MAG: hypothetical protein ACXVDF_17000 [Ktedonobacterales bacterium]